MIRLESASLWAEKCREISVRRQALQSTIESLSRTVTYRRTFLLLLKFSNERQNVRARILQVLRKLADGTAQIALRRWRDVVLLQQHAETHADGHCRQLRLSLALKRWKRSRNVLVRERDTRLRAALAYWTQHYLVRCMRRWREEVASTRRFQRMALEGAALVMGNGLVISRACKYL